MPEAINLSGVLDALDEKAEGDRLTVGAMVDSIGERGFGPLILAAAMIEIMPTGGIPGIPTAVALVVTLFAAQLVLGWRRPWLPGILRRRSFDREKFAKARDKVKKVTRRIDKVLKPRLTILVGNIGARVVGVVCILLAFTMPPLEIIPWLSYIPAFAIVLISTGLCARDGLVVLIGVTIGGFGLYTASNWLFF